jgi:hypothetical protein
MQVHQTARSISALRRDRPPFVIQITHRQQVMC